MKNLKKYILKFFVLTLFGLFFFNINALIIVNEPIHDSRCFDSIFQIEHPRICYHYDPFYRFWVSEEWYHHHYRALPIHHFAPFHGEVHRRHVGRHHHDD